MDNYKCSSGADLPLHHSEVMGSDHAVGSSKIMISMLFLLENVSLSFPAQLSHPVVSFLSNEKFPNCT